MNASGWSDDRITTLKTLWGDGLSAAQIAKSLGGVTRNAVIGKVYRLGLSGRATPSKPACAAKPPALSRAPTRRATVPKVVAIPVSAPQSQREGPGLVSSMALLGAHVCKWPIGDPKADDFSFCGRLAEGPYCPVHQAQGVRTGAAWRADRDPVVLRSLAGLA
jgi:GcrA cell cycle regulator